MIQCFSVGGVAKPSVTLHNCLGAAHLTDQIIKSKLECERADYSNVCTVTFQTEFILLMIGRELLLDRTSGRYSKSFALRNSLENIEAFELEELALSALKLLINCCRKMHRLLKVLLCQSKIMFTREKQEAFKLKNSGLFGSQVALLGNSISIKLNYQKRVQPREGLCTNHAQTQNSKLLS